MSRGIPLELFEFMQGLYENNTRQWFDEHRSRYEEIIKPTLRSIVSSLAPAVKLLNPNLETAPKFNKTISRLHNDTRFHKNRPPFKRYLFISFPEEGHRWSDAPILYLAIHRQGLWFGYWSGEPLVFDRDRWQVTLRKYRSLFEEALKRNKLVQNYSQFTDSEEDGPGGSRPIPNEITFWTHLETISVGKFYAKSDPALAEVSFTNRAIQHLLDLYPLYIFQKSASVEQDLDEYWDMRQGFHFID